jgi:hypothetical protein
MSRNAWKQVATGFVTGSTLGVDIPVSTALPEADRLYTYAVSLTNTSAATVAYYVEPDGRLSTLTLGVPIAADAAAVSNFSPRDAQSVYDSGNPQVATAASTAVINYRIFVKSR